jgi:DNA-binding response OmpR family regulator
MTKRVLIVEPNPRAGIILSDMVSREDSVAFIYTSFENALEGSRDEKFGLIMLDLDCLGDGAPDLVRQAGALWGKAMLSVMSSDDVSAELADALSEAGASEIIRKPFNRDRLKSLLDAAKARAKARMQVLVIEDSRTVRTFIAGALEPIACDVHMSETMEEALALLNQRPFDLVISDIFMPGMGGVEGIQRIRAFAPSVPCIAISGGYRDMTREKVLDAAKRIGANAALPKPFTAEALQTEVRGVTGGQSAA